MSIEPMSAEAAARAGREMAALMRELFMLPRSLTGDGVRVTLARLGSELPLDVVETPTGTSVFDWTVPREWNLREAWIDDPSGKRIVDASNSSLHVLGYSIPFDGIVSLEELRAHVYIHPDDPDAVPYRTSYWEERWGFCLSRTQLDSLRPGDYRVRIDATLAEGSLTSGELTIQGESEDTFLLSTYVCHPALANDNLSGVVLLWALAKTLSRSRPRYTYRFLWSPGTIGPLCWLLRNESTLDRIKHGLAISCVGDPGPLRYKRSRQGEAPVDRAAELVLGRIPGSIISAWSPTGGDERQFCSPGFDLPVGTFSRTPHGLFDEYHSSRDDLAFVDPDALAGSLTAVCAILAALEENARYRNLSPYGEPQLGRRGLYSAVPEELDRQTALLWLLSLSEGNTDLMAIAARSGLELAELSDAAVTLERHELLERVD